VPEGKEIDAVFDNEPLADPEMVPFIVMVTELLAGKVAIVPDTNPAPDILIVLGHTAPFSAFAQLAVKPLMAALTASEKTVPPAALGPALLMTNE
jgi:hypothetical protein